MANFSPNTTGKIVAMQPLNGRMIVACEYAIFEIGEDGEMKPIEERKNG